MEGSLEHLGGGGAAGKGQKIAYDAIFHSNGIQYAYLPLVNRMFHLVFEAQLMVIIMVGLSFKIRTGLLI